MVETINKLAEKSKKFKFNIQWKIVLSGLVVVAVFIAIIMAIVLPKMEQALQGEKEAKTKEHVQVAWNILDSCYALEESGAMTRAEAQELAKNQVKTLRYGDTLEDYYWINDYDCMMVMHPFKPELDGTDVSNNLDPTGHAIFVDFVQICKAQKEGFSTYQWQYKDDVNRIEPKLSYVKAFEPWEWIVGTGIYTVDVQETVAESRNTVIMFSVGVALVSAIFLFIFSGTITKNIKKVATVADKLALGDADQEVDIKSGDETGDMGRSLGRVISYLKEMSQAADSIAEGDLTATVTPKSDKDTLGNAFSKMITNLSGLISQVKSNADTIASASDQLSNAAEQSGSATNQIANVSQQVAKGAEEQSKGIGEVKNAIDQLSKAIDLVASGSQEQAKAADESISIVQQVSSAADQTAKNAQEAANVASQAAEVANEGVTTVEKTIEGMGKINVSMSEVSQKITQLGKHSEEIGGMIAVIDDIAAQTNSLALNAAIEAARAGEQGRGFAVVADEVKKLAERTAKETQEIASLVGTVQKGVSECIKAADDGSKEAEEGSLLANEAGNALNQIMEAVRGMTSQIEQISAAAEEMSASSNEMVNVVDNVSKVAEQNSAASEEMAANKTQLSDSANTVAGITEENSAATQEMSASAEEMSAQVQQVVASSQSLTAMSQELMKAVALFQVNGASDSNGNGKGKELLKNVTDIFAKTDSEETLNTRVLS